MKQISNAYYEYRGNMSSEEAQRELIEALILYIESIAVRHWKLMMKSKSCFALIVALKSLLKKAIL